MSSGGEGRADDGRIPKRATDEAFGCCISFGDERFGLMGATPEGPCDDAGGLVAPWSAFEGDALDEKTPVHSAARVL
jgi:hypothetical protein